MAVSVAVTVTVADVPTVGMGSVRQLHADEMSELEIVWMQVGKRELSEIGAEGDGDGDGDDDGDADDPEDDDPLEL